LHRLSRRYVTVGQRFRRAISKSARTIRAAFCREEEEIKRD